MSGVPYTFASATSSIPLSELDSNFATPVTIGTTSVALGNTVTTLANVALANVTISSVASGIPNNFLANSSVTIGNTSVSLGSTVTSLGNVTLTNVTIQGGTSNVSTNSIVNGTSNVAIASANGAVTMVTNGNTAVTIDTSQTATFVNTVKAPNLQGPAFSCGQSASSQTLTNGSVNTIVLDAKDFDTAGCFNNTGSTVTLNGLSVPAYCFAPNVAGYYQINGTIRLSGAATVETWLGIYKNGSLWKRGIDLVGITTGSQQSLVVNTIIYMNGTGDYLNMICQQSNGSSQSVSNSSGLTWLQGCLIRSA